MLAQSLNCGWQHLGSGVELSVTDVPLQTWSQSTCDTRQHTLNLSNLYIRHPVTIFTCQHHCRNQGNWKFHVGSRHSKDHKLRFHYKLPNSLSPIDGSTWVQLSCRRFWGTVSIVVSWLLPVSKALAWAVKICGFTATGIGSIKDFRTVTNASTVNLGNFSEISRNFYSRGFTTNRRKRRIVDFISIAGVTTVDLKSWQVVTNLPMSFGSTC